MPKSVLRKEPAMKINQNEGTLQLVKLPKFKLISNKISNIWVLSWLETYDFYLVIELLNMSNTVIVPRSTVPWTIFLFKILFLFSHLFWDFWVLSSVTTMLTYYYFSSMFNGNGPSGGAAEFSFARGGLNRWLRVSNDPPLTKLSFQTYCRSKCFILKFIVTSYKTKVATKFLIYLFNEIF